MGQRVCKWLDATNRVVLPNDLKLVDEGGEKVIPSKDYPDRHMVHLEDLDGKNRLSIEIHDDADAAFAKEQLELAIPAFRKLIAGELPPMAPITMPNPVN